MSFDGGLARGLYATVDAAWQGYLLKMAEETRNGTSLRGSASARFELGARRHC